MGKGDTVFVADSVGRHRWLAAELRTHIGYISSVSLARIANSLWLTPRGSRVWWGRITMCSVALMRELPPLQVLHLKSGLTVCEV
jgi:hypothetical protein